LIATGIVGLVIAVITLLVPMDFLRGFRLSANVGGLPLRLRPAVLCVADRDKSLKAFSACRDPSVSET